MTSHAYPDIEPALMGWLPARIGCPVVLSLTANPPVPIVRMARVGGSETWTLDALRLDFDCFDSSYRAAMGLAQELRTLFAFDMHGAQIGPVAISGAQTVALPRELPWDVPEITRVGITAQIFATA